jgi:hypothetical protein
VLLGVETDNMAERITTLTANYNARKMELERIKIALDVLKRNRQEEQTKSTKHH